MLKIDLFHDTVCPWCRIGKRHLELALEEWEEDVEIEYHAFFLNPGIPAEGYDYKSYMRDKGGGRFTLEQLFQMPTERGAEVGLTFNFDAVERAPNSLLSHQLIFLTPDDQRGEMIDAIYKAYFEDGRDIGKLDVLVEIAREQGLDAAEIRRQLEAGAGRDAILAEARWAQQQGISGVPFYIIDGRLAFSGAQPPHMIRRVLEQAAAERAEEARAS